MSEEKFLTPEQVNETLKAFNFLEFSNSYRESYYNNTGGYLTPDAVNRQLQNINMNPVEATIDGIEQALKSPKDSESILRDYATSAENNSMYYKRLVRYFPDMASFHLSFDCINIEKDSEYSSKEYKADMEVVKKYATMFNYRGEFQTVLRQLIRQGCYYCVFRQDGDKYTLQELPPDFCKITGRHEYGLLFDFNMQWFIGNYGVDINMYPPIFKKFYRDVFNKTTNKYKPSGDVDTRHSSFMYWHQCSPSDGFWSFKISPELATIIPYFAPLLKDISFEDIVRGLQQDKYFIEASKLLVGIIGMNKEAKSGQVANQINMTPDMLGKFMGVARKGLNKQIGLVALPMDSIETVDFDVNKENMASDNTENTAKQSISSFDAIYATDKLNSHQSKLASAIDMNFVKSLYEMFESFMEYFINSNTKKYKFRIRFNDMNIPDQQSQLMTSFKDYAAMGLVDIQMAARAYDMDVFELSNHLSMTKAFGLDKKLMPLMSLNNQSSGGSPSGQKGRPSKPNSDNENTNASWDRGSNDLK